MWHEPSEKDVWLAEVGTGVSRASTFWEEQAGMVWGRLAEAQNGRNPG